jgi:hypothetical protein
MNPTTGPAVSRVPDDLVDAVTNASWTVITRHPRTRRLYPGYWVAVRGVVRDRLERAGPGPDGEALEGLLASEIVIRLEDILRGTPVLMLVSTELPGAIHAALAAARRPPEAPAGPPGERGPRAVEAVRP